MKIAGVKKSVAAPKKAAAAVKGKGKATVKAADDGNESTAAMSVDGDAAEPAPKKGTKAKSAPKPKAATAAKSTTKAVAAPSKKRPSPPSDAESVVSEDDGSPAPEPKRVVVVEKRAKLDPPPPVSQATRVQRPKLTSEGDDAIPVKSKPRSSNASAKTCVACDALTLLTVQFVWRQDRAEEARAQSVERRGRRR